ncbi:MAG: PqqD family peptide modification chaperone, partial [Nevskiales bacterium]
LSQSLVVLRRDSQQLFVLNSTSRFIWDAIQAGNTATEIALRLSTSFAVSLEQAQADVDQTLAQWQQTMLAPPSTDECSNTALSQQPEIGMDGPLGQPIHVCHYQLAGKCFAVRVYDHGILELLTPILAGLVCDQPLADVCCFDIFKQDGRWVLQCDKQSSAQHADPAVVALYLRQAVMERVQQGSDRLAILHAAGVSASGRCIVMPAPGGSGKSTLCAALVAAGMDCVGDDILPLLDNGQVVPVPASIGLKQGSWAIVGQYFPQLESSPVYASGSARIRFLVNSNPNPDRRADLPASLPVHCLLFPSYQAGAATTLARITPEESLALIIESNTHLSRPIQAAKVAGLIAWVESTPAFSMTFSQLPEAVAQVQALFNTEPDHESLAAL